MKNNNLNIILVLLVLFCLQYNTIYAQEKYTLKGKVLSADNRAISYASLYIPNLKNGCNADDAGIFNCTFDVSLDDMLIIISATGYTADTFIYKNSGDFRIILFEKNEELKSVEIVSTTDRMSGMTRINPLDINSITTGTASIESILKTMPGISSNNELTSQYSVRGGNFDENMVYINEIEVYKPQLIRSGQQEGMSAINSDLVSGVRFSAGGFDASFGDRMASVLDITYKKPIKNQGSFNIGLLGAGIHYEGLSKNKKFSYLSGIRYYNKSLVLNSLKTQGEYSPQFMDWQTYMDYELTKKVTISLLNNISNTSYYFVPKELEQAVGSLDNMMKVNIYYNGQEFDRFLTYQTAIGFNYNASENVKLKWTNSFYSTQEYETFDILAQYYISEIDNAYTSSIADSASYIGVGNFQTHARNSLQMKVYSSQLKGQWKLGMGDLKFGIETQQSSIADNLREWKMVDSANYSVPNNDNNIQLYNARIADKKIFLNKSSTYSLYVLPWAWGRTEYTANIGGRLSWFSYSRELIASPRFILTIKPGWRRDYLFRAALGMYIQPPAYKELRYPDGQLNPFIVSQKSKHFLFGFDHSFIAWGRPFRMSIEGYYKNYTDLIPYKIDNVRIIYAGENNAKGYVAGIDTRINGEFIPGTESWLSLTLLQTEEDINNDSYVSPEGVTIYPGYYPRPTDQLMNLGLFFQDYLPGDPSYRMLLSLMFGSSLPYSFPDNERYDLQRRMPPYRRVDIGAFKTFRDLENGIGKKKDAHLRHISLGLEIFNLFDIQNTISYLWLRAISTEESSLNAFSVPQYLTRRRINLKLVVKF